MSDRTRLAYERWAPAYDSDPNPHLALEYPILSAAVAAESGDRILDAACGTGRYAIPFAAAGANVTGLDFSEAMLARARIALPSANLCRADLTRPLPLSGSCFDKVNCAQALKHLEALGPSLREFARVLRPGGLLVFSVTHPDMTWDGYEMRQPVTVHLDAEADIHHHPWSAYETALVDAGFGDIRPQAVRVSSAIASFLTPASFVAVAGRPQVLVCSARRADGMVDSATG